MKSLLTSVFILIAMGLSLGISSCSDDTTTNPNPSNDIFPLTSGSYFIYNNIRLDSLTGQPDLNALTTDSMIVKKDTVVAGVSASEFQVFRLGQLIRSDYYSKTAQTISGYWQYIPPGITLNQLVSTLLPQNRRWSKFADYSTSNEWAIADTTLTGISIPFSGLNVPTNAVISMKGKKLTAGTEVVNGVSYPNTTKFEIKLSITPTVTIPGLPASQLSAIIVYQYVWVANNVGIIKEDFPNIDVSITGLGTPIPFKADGLRRELIRYSIK